MSNFKTSNFQNVKFQNAKIQNVNFSKCQISKCPILKCQLIKNFRFSSTLPLVVLLPIISLHPLLAPILVEQQLQRINNTWTNVQLSLVWKKKTSKCFMKCIHLNNNKLSVTVLDN
ncbi:hypothetical protein ACQ4LE_003947 [Meloidogyne hapla]